MEDEERREQLQQLQGPEAEEEEEEEDLEDDYEDGDKDSEAYSDDGSTSVRTCPSPSPGGVLTHSCRVREGNRKPG